MANNCSIIGRICLPQAINSRLATAIQLTIALSLLFAILPATPSRSEPAIKIPIFGPATNLPASPSLDFSINGSGYFVGRDPLTGSNYFTRYGALTLDVNGFLITPTGMRVQGFNDPALSTIGNLKVDALGSPSTNSYVASFEIQSNGLIVVTLSDNSSFVRGRILLQTFQNPSALIPQGDRNFASSDAAGPLALLPPGAGGNGYLVSGTLEQLVPTLQLSRIAAPPQTFTQGILVPSGVPADIGIEGNGFFLLRRTNDNTFFATRAGAFYLDASGYVVHYSGLRLQGYAGPALTTIGDLQIAVEVPSSNNTPLLVQSFSINRLGTITESLSDGTSLVSGQILLANCSNPNLVARTNFDLYPIDTNTGPWSPAATPLTGDLGWLVSGFVELSQFDTILLSVRSNLNFFIQSALDASGISANLAINGNGFFTVRDPVANLKYATRFGDFVLDATSHLVTSDGFRLQGLSNSALTQTGDLTIDATGAPDPNSPVTSYNVDSQGRIQVQLADGTTFLRGQVLLQVYQNPQALMPAGGELYSNLTAALPIFTNGLSNYVLPGAIQSGFLEEFPGLPPRLQLPPASGWRVFVSGLTAGTIQSSTDLQHWDTLGQISGSDLNEAEYFDSAQSPQKFYRVLAQP